MEKHLHMKKTNLVAIIAHSSNVLLLTAFTFVEIWQQGESFIRAFIMLAIGIAPVAAEIAAFCRNRDTMAIKHLLGIGYAFFYTYAICCYSYKFHTSPSTHVAHCHIITTIF